MPKIFYRKSRTRSTCFAMIRERRKREDDEEREEGEKKKAKTKTEEKQRPSSSAKREGEDQLASNNKRSKEGLNPEAAVFVPAGKRKG